MQVGRAREPVRAAPVSVTITDVRGRTETMQINEAGNFSSTRRLNAPYKVAVTSPKGTRVMQRTINGGDCNGCHTQWGDAGAPGRIAES
ncbi:MAG: hypothetical protein KF837_28760 [Labilithrix sp.]|nr:hypothetical protein [Labilithrix sp.]